MESSYVTEQGTDGRVYTEGTAAVELKPGEEMVETARLAASEVLSRYAPLAVKGGLRPSSVTVVVEFVPIDHTG